MQKQLQEIHNMSENNMQNGLNQAPVAQPSPAQPNAQPSPAQPNTQTVPIIPMTPVQPSPAQPITRPARTIDKRKGSKLATAAMITGIVTCAVSLVSAFMIYAYAYGRQNQDVIMTAFCSIALAVPAFIALILGIIGKVRGGHIAKLIVTIVTILYTYLFIAFDLYILLYYIGMTF